MSAELGLAVAAAVDLCLNYGKKLIDLYRTIKGAHDEVESTLLRLESSWNKTKIQLRVMRSLSAKLDVDHVRIQEQLLEKLTRTLSAALVKLESVIGTESKGYEPTAFKAMKYAFLHRSIQQTVSELRDWQNEYDPTWFLVVLIHDKLVDTVLEQPRFSSAPGSSPASAVSHLRRLRNGATDNEIHVNLESEDFDLSKASTLKYTTTKLLFKGAGTSEKAFLIDTLSCRNYVDVAKARREAENLAKRLKVIDTKTSGLLRCQGLVKSSTAGAKELSHIHFVFRMPAPPATSLREELLRPSGVSLSRILHIAQCLAKAVSFIHVCDFVHKNIRPETILTFPRDDAASPYGSAYLLGFDGFRDVDNQTLKAGDTAPERNLYRHPSRQGLDVQAAYVMQHDIYALGVCLLEIGLWTSFVAYDYYGHPQIASENLGHDTIELCLCGPPQDREKVKEHLVMLAREKLPLRMGDKYARVVLHCLTALDPDNSTFNCETMRDEDGVVVGVRFIEKVLLALSDISL
ncbi:b9b558d2-2ab2-47c5-bbe5-d8c5ea359f67 [Thermothielavioides terrestris]|uniref:Protein kinase domain-containing protein n=2 Tax=Thermothielavioides terrestris TaxID=2587410 RepID=G2R8C3_THETT|nr:uncharacterized protein THITE_2117604 [Thermothielavioides terrestris NRRL 8126]AEO68181.1 hypothetical protein THITE_2117604 [Thermothielavioides terrestris NRRL 8126]SPQ24570.1 b9b558d2-2ab2-47c5-bbe5-d8c5ea359f67 [Thermothielavioides terrestris]